MIFFYFSIAHKHIAQATTWFVPFVFSSQKKQSDSEWAIHNLKNLLQIVTHDIFH